MNTTSSIGKSSETNNVRSRIFILVPRIGFIVLLALLVISVWGENQSTKSADWVLHTIEVQSELSKLLSNLQDAETGQRGFLLTHNDDYLEPYTKSKTHFLATKDRLRTLTKDNSVQQKNINHIQTLVTQKLHELQQTILLSKSGNHDEAMNIVKNNEGKNTMDKIRAIVADMDKLETNLLKQRREEFNTLSSFVWITEFLTFIAFLIIATLIIRKLNSDFKQQGDDERALRKVNKELQQSNQELENFAYVASHDLKAPLRGINNLANWIEEDLKGALQGEAKENMEPLT